MQHFYLFESNQNRSNPLEPIVRKHLITWIGEWNASEQLLRDIRVEVVLTSSQPGISIPNSEAGSRDESSPHRRKLKQDGGQWVVAVCFAFRMNHGQPTQK